MGTGPSKRFKRKDKSRPSSASRGDASYVRETTGTRNAEMSTVNFMGGEPNLRGGQGEEDGRFSRTEETASFNRLSPLTGRCPGTHMLFTHMTPSRPLTLANYRTSGHKRRPKAA